MIDLHCHILPGLDDGAADLSVSTEMAKAFVAELDSGHLLSLADTRYVLVEPPHHIAPPRLEDLFFALLVAGYVPILTHPERLTWIKSQYLLVQRLVHAGCWMQITAGSLTGAFGRNARYWAERMLNEGCVHLIATDAHDVNRRPPNLNRGRELAAKRVGEVEAQHLVVTRPEGVLRNDLPSNLPRPEAAVASSGIVAEANDLTGTGDATGAGGFSGRRFAGRLRRFFN